MHEAAAELKGILSGVIAILLGALSWMIKAKVSRTDKRLDDLEAWKSGVDIGIVRTPFLKMTVILLHPHIWVYPLDS